MYTIKCNNIKDFNGNITSVLVFGLIRKVNASYTEKAAKQAIKNGTYYYCNLKDNEENIYRLYSDYDPCLKITKTIILKMD